MVIVRACILAVTTPHLPQSAALNVNQSLAEYLASGRAMKSTTDASAVLLNEKVQRFACSSQNINLSATISIDRFPSSDQKIHLLLFSGCFVLLQDTGFDQFVDQLLHAVERTEETLRGHDDAHV